MQNYMKKLTLFTYTFLNIFLIFPISVVEPTTEMKAHKISLARMAFVITLRDHNKIENLKKHPKFANIPGVEESLQQRILNHDQAFKECYQDDSCREAMAPSLFESSDPRIEILALTPEGRNILANFQDNMEACNEDDTSCQNQAKENFNIWYASNR